jgi:peptidoglycan/LPS O-acetylase OafA/YrhL
MTTRPIYVPSLNGWRAVAVLLVIGAHSHTMLLNSDTTAGNMLAIVASHGGIGVDIFFAVSGFLICTLLLHEKERTGAINLASFYIRRVFRIIPPMWVYLATVVVLKLYGILDFVSSFDITSAALFFKNYTQGPHWYTDHFWSLAIEEHFYLFVPFLLAVLSWKRSLQATLVIVVICASVRAVEYKLLTSTLESATETRIDAIMYGAIAALLCDRFSRQIKSYLTLTTVLFVLCTVLIGCALFSELPIRRTLIALAIPVPIVFTVLNPTHILGRWLELKPVQSIGKISYSLYIWQMMFLVPAYRPMPLIQSFPAAFILTFSCAIASYLLVERPCIRFGHSLASRSLATKKDGTALPTEPSVLPVIFKP